MDLLTLRNNWHNTNSNILWKEKYNFEDKLNSISYYIVRYVLENKMLHKLNNSSNKLLKEIISGSGKLGLTGIRHLNTENKSYFESFNEKDGKKIKHTAFYSEYLKLQNVGNITYERSHQISAASLKNLLIKNKIKTQNLEYFIALIYIMENSCVYAPKKTKSFIENFNLMLCNPDFELLNGKNIERLSLCEKENIIYQKLYNHSTGRVSSKQISVKDFIDFQDDLRVLVDFLLHKSLGIDNGTFGKYQSLSHAFHHHSKSLSVIDNTTDSFLINPDNILEVRNICFDLLF